MCHKIDEVCFFLTHFFWNRSNKFFNGSRCWNGLECSQHTLINNLMKQYSILDVFFLSLDWGKENCHRYTRKYNNSDKVFEAIFDLTEFVIGHTVVLASGHPNNTSHYITLNGTTPMSKKMFFLSDSRMRTVYSIWYYDRSFYFFSWMNRPVFHFNSNVLCTPNISWSLFKLDRNLGLFEDQIFSVIDQNENIVN